MDYQTGPRIGTAVPPQDEAGSVRDVIGPNTDAGQAFLVAGIGLGLVYLAVGSRASGGIVSKAGATLETVALVAGASWAANYFARMYAIRHPDAPLAAGVNFDA